MSHLLRMRDFAGLYDIVNRNYTTEVSLSDADLISYIDSIKRILTALRIGLVEILEQG